MNEQKDMAEKGNPKNWLGWVALFSLAMIFGASVADLIPSRLWSSEMSKGIIVSVVASLAASVLSSIKKR